MNRVTVTDLSKQFKIGFHKNQSALGRFTSLFSGIEPKKIIWALKDVTFSVKEGEIFAVIGNNGSGKSTLLRIIAGIYDKQGGEVQISGKIVSLMNLTAGLREKMRVRENIQLCGTLFGLSNRLIKERFDSIVAFAELEDFLNTKIYQFSDGMKERLAFSLAIHCDADILLLDEVFGVGDQDFRIKSVKKMYDLIKQRKTILLVSHNLDLVEEYCHRAIVLERGKIVASGNARAVVDRYRHHNYDIKQ
ncbi:MAG: ABC transporter ATP-binding protein [Candidatus Omnitrophica bacterium]|nr:ABC transporter ATP-binding protein [Candidatus Omnitrophota bacterium]